MPLAARPGCGRGWRCEGRVLVTHGREAQGGQRHVRLLDGWSRMLCRAQRQRAGRRQTRCQEAAAAACAGASFGLFPFNHSLIALAREGGQQRKRLSGAAAWRRTRSRRSTPRSANVGVSSLNSLSSSSRCTRSILPKSIPTASVSSLAAARGWLNGAGVPDRRRGATGLTVAIRN